MSKMTKQNQKPVRFIEATEDPLPAYVWIIDQFTGKAIKMSLCDLQGARKMIDYFNAHCE